MGTFILGIGAAGLFLAGVGSAINSISDLMFKRKVNNLLDAYTELMDPVIDMCGVMIEQIKKDMEE